MNDSPDYREYRFPPEIIGRAVWLYHRFTLSFRDIEDLLAERGVEVSYETVRQWCMKFGPEYARRIGRHLLQAMICRSFRARVFAEWRTVVGTC